MSHNRRLPKQSKTLPIKGSSVRGDGRDAGKYYKCWNCGFVCNIERDALGGSNDSSGIVVIDSTVTSYGSSSDPLSGLATLSGGPEHCHVLLKQISDTETETLSYAFSTQDGTGCPMCHTKNWKGEHP